MCIQQVPWPVASKQADCRLQAGQCAARAQMCRLGLCAARAWVPLSSTGGRALHSACAAPAQASPARPDPPSEVYVSCPCPCSAPAPRSCPCATHKSAPTTHTSGVFQAEAIGVSTHTRADGHSPASGPADDPHNGGGCVVMLVCACASRTILTPNTHASTSLSTLPGPGPPPAARGLSPLTRALAPPPPSCPGHLCVGRRRPDPRGWPRGRGPRGCHGAGRGGGSRRLRHAGRPPAADEGRHAQR